MSQVEENDSIAFGNIENFYEEFNKVVSAKNEIQSTITLNSEELVRHQVKVEELEDILHDLRLKITTNPILKKLNMTCEEDAVDQRKSAEGILSDLRDIPSKMDIYDENFAKLKEEQERVEKLDSSLKNKLEICLLQFNSSKAEWEKQVHDSEVNKKDLLGRYCELQKERDALLNVTSNEKDISKSLSFQKECKLTILQRIREMQEQNSKLLTNLENQGMKSNDLSIFEEKEGELNEEIKNLGEQKNELMNKIEECKQNIADEKILKDKLSKELRKSRLISKKKTRLSSIQKLEIKSGVKKDELLKLEGNKLIKEKYLTQLDLDLEAQRKENNEMYDEISRLKENEEIFIEEKKELNDNQNELSDKLSLLNEKISIFCGDNSKLEVLINVNNEKKSSILNEIEKTDEKLREIGALIEGLNEQIAYIQVDITEKERLPETPAYEEMEKENEILDSKIKKYKKAIEALKKIRAASILKKRKNYNENSDTDDSMVMPNKRSRI